MSRFLLAAEADQIQDFIFRSSRLREVVGASQLLSRFCREGAVALMGKYGGSAADLVVNDGGAFRALFHDADVARQFGRDLAELYRRLTDGSLSVAEPVEVKGGDFRAANRAAHDGLREAKRSRGGVEMPPHFPYAAFCASCGVGLAERHMRSFEDERPNYLCPTCRVKREARKDPRSGFLEDFLEAVNALLVGRRFYRRHLPHQSDEVGELDPRHYVAYLVADGNGMGSLFSRCDAEQMRELSGALPRTARAALAEPCPGLLARFAEAFKEGDPRRDRLPVLPLILGGDDIFALLPAPYALDFARRFCEAFQREMQATLKELDLLEGGEMPTVAVGMAICKSNYPFTLAYHRAHRRMEYAKRYARSLALSTGEHLSAVDFEVVTGNEVIEFAQEESCEVQPSLRPYLVCKAQLPNTVAGYGLGLDTLLDQRFELCSLPRTRRAQLRALYDCPELRVSDLESWSQRLQWILDRLGRDAKARRKLAEAIERLGDRGKPQRGYWRDIDGNRPGGSSCGHGLPDLIEAWDYLYRLDKPRQAYEVSE